MDQDTPTVKPAWLSTEFWLAVIPTALFLIKMFTGKDTSGIDIAGLATLAASICAAGYAISRALQKRAVIQATALITNQRLAIAHDERNSTIARAHEQQMQTARYAPQIENKQWSTLEDRIAALEARLPKPRSSARKTATSRR